MATDRRIVIGNWKMNPPTILEAKKIFNATVKAVMTVRGPEVVVCPPAVFLPMLKSEYKGKRITFGVQDVDREEKGAKTGQMAASMARSVGAGYTIIGHSERRAMGETNEDIAKKLERASDAGLFSVLCVGEQKRDQAGNHFLFVREQLKSALNPLPRSAFPGIIVAYEPIWAIGKTAKDAMKPADLHEMGIFIRKTIAEFAGFATASDLSVLYGGSVEASNAGILMRDGFVSGFLVGHASLVPAEFKAIVEAAAAN